MAETRPSFPWYPKDWLGSASVSSMPLAAQGLYMRLISFAWLSDGLPTDEEALRRLASVERAEWRRVWPIVAPRWMERDGRLYQRKLETVRQSTADYTEARREAGRKGGQRSAEARREANGTAQPRSKPEANDQANLNPSIAIASAKKKDTPTPHGAGAEAQSFVDAWNRLTLPPIPRCLELTKDREKRIRRRLSERPMSQWEAAMQRANLSPFCRGENDRGWRINLDFLIANEGNVVKVMEGKYDRPGSLNGTAALPEVDWRNV